MWVEAGTRQEFERVRKKVVESEGRQVVVFWHEGQPYAFDNICIHKGRELVGGVVLNGRVVCPGHQWAYELGSGYCRERDRCQPVFAAKEEAGTVYVDIEPAPPREMPEAAPEPEEAAWPHTSS
jgi:nitrite reductase (NADH) small subunit